MSYKQQCQANLGSCSEGQSCILCSCLDAGEQKWHSEWTLPSDHKSGSAGLVGTMDGTTSSVVKSIAWNKNIVCNRTSNTAWAPGAFVGAVTKNGGKYADCYRRADMVLTDVENGMTLFDQENVENDFPAAPSYSTETTQRAYHGKAAAADATASSVAKTLGWDEAVWDLSGDLPVLK